MGIKIEYKKDGKVLQAEIPEGDFEHFKEKYEGKKLGAEKKAPVKRSASKKEEKEK